MRSLSLALLLLLAACGAPSNRLAGADSGVAVGRATLASGGAELALQMTDTMLNAAPSDPAALLLRADALVALDRGAEAAPIFRRVIALDPASSGARLGLGRAVMATDAPEAERLFTAVLAADPANAAAANNLGIARDLQNRHSEAQLAYRRALTLAPAMQAAAVNLALSLGLSGQSAEAIPLLRPLAQAPNATAKVRHDMAAVLAMAGERGSAAQMLAVDLPDREVEQALGIFSALRPGNGAVRPGASTNVP